MFIVVTYDISDPKRLRKIAKIMENFGTRVQKSVFECHLNDKQYLKMKKKIEKTIDMSIDTVRYYFLCLRCQATIEISGTGFITKKEDIIVI